MQGISMGTLCVSSRTVCLSLSCQKWRYSVYSREGLGPRVIPWQRQSGCQFVAYLAYIIGSKFEQHHSNISWDIQDFVINFCTYTICDVINFWTRTWISLEREKIFKKRKRHSCSLWEAFQISISYFSLHRHFKTGHNKLLNILWHLQGFHCGRRVLNGNRSWHHSLISQCFRLSGFKSPQRQVCPGF